ncbi:cytosine permease [Leucobacter insecticola]|uniref:cytosine permease n=1 Tax=Leucobacter insecticola TaxID=2714934 RepID=UPI00244DE89A|nr:cytosine permease [Leucobacter insecticola]
MTATTQSQVPIIEDKTIQPIPLNERHGKARDLFTIWFGSNIMVLTMVTGALATTVFGLDFWSAVLGVAIGNLAGAVFMALHSAQGPKLGVPQMVQTRGQFGSYGALLVVIVTVLMYVGSSRQTLFWVVRRSPRSFQAFPSMRGSSLLALSASLRPSTDTASFTLTPEFSVSCRGSRLSPGSSW